MRSRRDAAFDIPDPEDISENPTAVEVERLRREWWPKLEHHAHIVVVMSRTLVAGLERMFPHWVLCEG